MRSPYKLGHYYEHPEDGVIHVTGGYYLDPIYNRLSNFWYWTQVMTGKKKNGYGRDCPEVKVLDQYTTLQLSDGSVFTTLN